LFCILIAMNPNIFKAYDIRGKYPEEINEEAVAEITKALAKHFSAKGGSAFGGKKGKIIIGHDARLSSESLYKIAVRTLNAKPSTLNPIPVGMITTPMLYFLVNKLKAAGGIMITASHNPKEYNGLKVVGPTGDVMSGEEIRKLLRSELSTFRI